MLADVKLTKPTDWIDKINPTFKTVIIKEVILAKEGDEKTVIRFTLDKNGDLVSTNAIQKSLTRAFLEDQFPPNSRSNALPKIPAVQNPFAPEVKWHQYLE